MLTGQCPSCGSKTVFMKQKGIEVGGGTDVLVHTSPGADLKPTSTDDYICTTCGYFERHLSNLIKLNEVAESWIPVG
jgi:DNA-directed RNA polymerase subunit RPC12/RpoP